MAKGQPRIAAVLKKYEEDLLADWLRELRAIGASRDQRLSDAELSEQAREFLSLLQQATQRGGGANATSAEWAEINGFLDELSRKRVLQGFTSEQTATFIFSLKNRCSAG